MHRVDGYLPIADYALIGDGRTAALVGRDGAIDWLCLPDVDSPSVFARLVDAPRGGAFTLAPAEPFEAERRYVEGTNVLETTFRCASGDVRVTDAMTLVGGDIAPLREILRRVEGLAGDVPLEWRVEPRFRYGTGRTQLARRNGVLVAQCRADAVALATWGTGGGEIADGAFMGAFRARAGETALFSLGAAHGQPLVLPGRADVEGRLEHTLAFWRRWSAGAAYDGPWRDHVVRSALALKLLVHSPSGAIVAAPTTSLPEWLGGARNWDYRFAWVRDASYTVDALLDLGYEDEAAAFFWWLMHASRMTQPRLQVLYRVDGSHRAPERELPHLDGYRGSRPVRIGNGACGQEQLDIYGTVLDAAWRFARDTGALDRDTGKELAQVADYVAEHWHEADSGIWEVRSESAHFTQSKAMCWVALERACQLAGHGSCPDRRSAWEPEKARIRAFVEERCWDAERRSYVRAPSLPELDASLLTLSLLEYDDGRADRIVSTIDAIRRELQDGPRVRRYLGEDGLEGDEGAFVACTFWLANALARAGRADEAAELMDSACALVNDVGLLAEEVTADGVFLGNFPQGLSHLALVNAAISIRDRAEAA